jgi:hypothetical protein
MIGLASCCFVAGSLATAWLLHIAQPGRVEVAATDGEHKYPGYPKFT